jgi:S-adenosylmethionine-dependent methyltransferase
MGQSDLDAHAFGRMMELENVVIPWVEEVFDLGGARVLEIGCGTGSSTIPFALRARSVRACDLSGPSMEAARQRAALLGIDNIVFQILEPTWAQSEGSLQTFAEQVGEVDVILMVALLEHMTIRERLAVLRTLWGRLRPGGILVVYETPNRLGFFDWHSFLLPFFHSLPDELALEYASRTPRSFFKVSETGDRVEALYRLGRGVSYHEFELAIGLEAMTVLNDGFSAHLRHRRGLTHKSFDRALFSLFNEHLPNVPRGFTRPSLDLIIQKSEGGGAARPELPRELPEELREEPAEARREEREELIQRLEAAMATFKWVARHSVEAVREPRRFRARLGGWLERKLRAARRVD